MKKFSEFKKIRKVNEQEVTLSNNTELQTTGGEDVNTDKSVVNNQTQSQSQSEEQPKNQPSSPVKFFSKLLESREMAQVYHWTVKGDMGSHAAHLALEAYYDGIICHIDELVEVYQGQYELIEGYDVIDTTETKSKDRVEYFQSVAQYIKENRNTSLSAEDTHLQNIIDEVVGLLYKTLYKLKYNK
jgi:DNA-binding ferritin-like protein